MSNSSMRSDCNLRRLRGLIWQTCCEYECDSVLGCLLMMMVLSAVTFEIDRYRFSPKFWGERKVQLSGVSVCVCEKHNEPQASAVGALALAIQTTLLAGRARWCCRDRLFSSEVLAPFRNVRLLNALSEGHSSWCGPSKSKNGRSWG